MRWNAASNMAWGDCSAIDRPLCAWQVRRGIDMRERLRQPRHRLELPDLVWTHPAMCGRLPIRARLRARSESEQKGMHDPALRQRGVVKAQWLANAHEVNGRAVQLDLLRELRVRLIEGRDTRLDVAAHAGPGAAVGAHALAATDQQNLVAARCVAQQKA